MRRRRPIAIAIVAVVVVAFLTACSLDWVVIPKDAGPDAADDGGAESRATAFDAAKLAA